MPASCERSRGAPRFVSVEWGCGYDSSADAGGLGKVTTQPTLRYTEPTVVGSGVLGARGRKPGLDQKRLVVIVSHGTFMERREGAEVEVAEKVRCDRDFGLDAWASWGWQGAGGDCEKVVVRWVRERVHAWRITRIPKSKPFRLVYCVRNAVVLILTNADLHSIEDESAQVRKCADRAQPRELTLSDQSRVSLKDKLSKRVLTHKAGARIRREI